MIRPLPGIVLYQLKLNPSILEQVTLPQQPAVIVETDLHQIRHNPLSHVIDAAPLHTHLHVLLDRPRTSRRPTPSTAPHRHPSSRVICRTVQSTQRHTAAPAK